MHYKAIDKETKRKLIIMFRSLNSWKKPHKNYFDSAYEAGIHLNSWFLRISKSDGLVGRSVDDARLVEKDEIFLGTLGDEVFNACMKLKTKKGFGFAAEILQMQEKCFPRVSEERKRLLPKSKLVLDALTGLNTDESLRFGSELGDWMFENLEMDARDISELHLKSSRIIDERLFKEQGKSKSSFIVHSVMKQVKNYVHGVDEKIAPRLARQVNTIASIALVDGFDSKVFNGLESANINLKCALDKFQWNFKENNTRPEKKILSKTADRIIQVGFHLNTPSSLSEAYRAALGKYPVYKDRPKQQAIAIEDADLAIDALIKLDTPEAWNSAVNVICDFYEENDHAHHKPDMHKKAYANLNKVYKACMSSDAKSHVDIGYHIAVFQLTAMCEERYKKPIAKKVIEVSNAYAAMGTTSGRLSSCALLKHPEIARLGNVAELGGIHEKIDLMIRQEQESKNSAVLDFVNSKWPAAVSQPRNGVVSSGLKPL